MKCRGEIVAPSGVVGLSRQKSRMSFSELVGKIWEVVITSPNDRIQVNECLKCGDIEVDDMWQEMPTVVKDAVKEGGITVNGKMKTCDRCAGCISTHSMVYGLKERTH